MPFTPMHTSLDACIKGIAPSQEPDAGNLQLVL